MLMEGEGEVFLMEGGGLLRWRGRGRVDTHILCMQATRAIHGTFYRLIKLAKCHRQQLKIDSCNHISSMHCQQILYMA